MHPFLKVLIGKITSSNPFQVPIEKYQLKPISSFLSKRVLGFSHNFQRLKFQHIRHGNANTWNQR